MPLVAWKFAYAVFLKRGPIVEQPVLFCRSHDIGARNAKNADHMSLGAGLG